MFRVAVAVLLLGAAIDAHADEAGPDERVPPMVAPETRAIGPWKPYREQVAVVSMFPEGLDTQMWFGWKRPLSASDAILLKDSYLSLGFSPKVNPSFSRIGPFAEWQPLAIFRLSGGAEYVQFFSTFGNLQS